ncbi:MAG: sulfite exporter TauE/SafE family protein [Desulfobulbaceae bacterium]|nr:sulfite exporter TauE/SafE family protein [Desulfobulbaceae bacterium]HIJ89974.1 sulfite exporter TauE/SafE family protein [Deltaproteobacteria bacterium]
MYMYLPIALTSVNYLVVMGLGLGVGLLSGLFGVGGGFLMTPLLMMIGIPPTIAAATDANQIVAASASGTISHWRLGNVDFKMGFYLLIGGFAGGATGVQVIKILRATGGADFMIKMTYVIMLGLVGSFMFVESLNAMRKTKKVPTAAAPAAAAKVKKGGFFTALPLQIYFEKSGVTHSALVPLFLGTFVGVLAAIMGVGGGFLMVPVMIYMLRMPMHVVVGTSLFQILFTCIEVTYLQAYSNHTVDFMLALLLLVGSVFGAQIGTVLGRKLHGDQLKILLSLIVLAVTVKIILELVLEPSILLSYAGGH